MEVLLSREDFDRLLEKTGIPRSPMASQDSILSPAPVPAPLRARLALLARDIKVSHALFAMPWAILSTVMALHGSRQHAVAKLALIVLCMVAARTAAMASNRLLDATLDAKNPRTARRAIPGGRLSRAFVAGVLAFCALVFVAGAAGFWLIDANKWPVILALPVLAYLAAYPLMKRFTRLCHYYLGAALGLAPVCAWLAVTGHLAPPPFWMGAAVLLWTAGFDIIYACQDYQSDVALGVFSVPAKLGIGPALWVSRFTHLACLAMMVALGLSSPLLGPIYYTAVGAAGILLIVEHSLVRPNDLSKAGVAFFTINGIISLLIGTMGIIDVLRH